MNLFIIIPVALLILFALILRMGYARLKKGFAQANAAALQLTPEDIPALLEEAIEGLRAKYDLNIDLQQAEATAQALDDVFSDSYKLKNSFAKDDFYWYFALPMGALLGEFARQHTGGHWQKDEEGLCIISHIGEAELTARPFEKVLKQIQIRAPGDLYAYLMMPIELHRQRVSED